MSLHRELNRLPRLVYIGGVPVESSYHGSALLYRLLEDYPADRLVVIEADPLRSLPERRLPNIPYRRLPIAAARWFSTRFSQFAGSWVTLRPPKASATITSILTGFQPDAVLTVAHGYSWLSAVDFALKKKLPLHLVSHDYWPGTTYIFPGLAKRQQKHFSRAYSAAASRLCVSPSMEEEYSRLYKAPGQVLYPSRSRDCPTQGAIPATYSRESRQLVGAYAGNIFHDSVARMIRDLAELLENGGGRLLLFGPHSRERLEYWGLNRPNVITPGLLTSRDLLVRLQNEADFLFVPMQFDLDGSDHNMRLCFPSKIADYTATGLPLLIWGPDYCSAIRWAQQYAPVAEAVVSDSVEALADAVRRLGQTEHRRSLGTAARAVGDRLFSHQACSEVFYRSLLSVGTGHERSDILLAGKR